MPSLSKNCQSCGRDFDYRKKRAKNWNEIKYCSDECRKNKNKFDFKNQIIDLLNIRGQMKTICPSEVLHNNDKSNSVLMEHVRRSARILASENKIEILQGGKNVEPTQFKGPIRLRLK